MNEIINEEIFRIYKRCNITHFPINCFQIIETLGIPLIKYSSANEARRKSYHMVSDDSFKFKGKIYYNDLSPHIMRQRFSLMHELGHITLNHTGSSLQNEDEADRFSSLILAPRIAIHKMRCQDAQQIHDTFQISYQAANRALADYYNWFRQISQTTRKPTRPEQQIGELLFPAAPAAPASQTGNSSQKAPKESRRTTAKADRLQEYADFFNEMQQIHGTDSMFEHAESQFLSGDKKK